MIIIRPITKQDEAGFTEFAFNSTVGIRNLPKDKDRLHQKILHSEEAFARDVLKPGHEDYIFVLEDTETGKIGGTCGIYATMDPQNSCAYRIEIIRSKSNHPALVKEIKLLKLAPLAKPASEICSLYLDPSFRQSGQGRLLSLSRFMFIASHRQRFRSTLIAEIRGYIDDHQNSPFWDAVGKHFCHLSFTELMAQIDHGAISVREVMPHSPIYLDLLPKEVQEIIGKPHPRSQPAVDMLSHEGFTFNGEIDAFESGPSFQSKTSNVRSIRDSRVIKIETSRDVIASETPFILANTNINFRACYGAIELKNTRRGIISEQVADALKVKTGDLIRFVSMH